MPDKVKIARGEADGLLESLHFACRDRDRDRVHKLLLAGADPQQANRKEANGDGGNTPLWFAAQGSKAADPELATILIRAGANPDTRCEYGTTAAHMACSWGQTAFLRRLHELGADLTITDDDGVTPEQVARHGLAWQQTKISESQRSGVIAFFDELSAD